jgi:AcrR family transcriptional regulator
VSADGKTVPSVWTRRSPDRAEPALSRERIVAEALRLLDAEGIDSLSMRRLGSELKVGATSIYWHVPNKNALIELVVDEVYAELEVPEIADPAEWREATITCARSLRRLIIRHPWIVSVLGDTGLAYLGPNMMRMFDRMLSIFETVGMPLVEGEQAMTAVVGYVVGMASSEAAWLNMLARSELNERDWVENLWPSVDEAARAYPRLQNLYSAQRGRDPEGARNESFDYGLDRVLDGIEIQLRRDR